MCDCGHERDRAVVIIRSAVFTNLFSGSVCKRLINIANIREMKSAVHGKIAAAAIAMMCDTKIHYEGGWPCCVSEIRIELDFAALLPLTRNPSGEVDVGVVLSFSKEPAAGLKFSRANLCSREYLLQAGCHSLLHQISDGANSCAC